MAATEKLEELCRQAVNYYFVLKDVNTALACWREAASKGHVESMSRLYLALTPLSSEKAVQEEAMKWLCKGAERGNRTCVCNLGLAYQLGTQVDQDLSKAVSLYEKASEMGDSTAMFNLGVMYEQGEGVAQSFTRAAALYRDAANADPPSPEAVFNYAVCLEQGQGVAKDLSKAYEYFERAADGGDAQAYVSMAEFHLKGLGPVQRSLSKACLLYLKGANADRDGNGETQKELERFARQQPAAIAQTARTLLAKTEKLVAQVAETKRQLGRTNSAARQGHGGGGASAVVQAAPQAQSVKEQMDRAVHEALAEATATSQLAIRIALGRPCWSDLFEDAPSCTLSEFLDVIGQFVDQQLDGWGFNAETLKRYQGQLRDAVVEVFFGVRPRDIGAQVPPLPSLRFKAVLSHFNDNLCCLLRSQLAKLFWPTPSGGGEGKPAVSAAPSVPAFRKSSLSIEPLRPSHIPLPSSEPSSPPSSSLLSGQPGRVHSSTTSQSTLDSAAAIALAAAKADVNKKRDLSSSGFGFLATVPVPPPKRPTL